MVRILCFAAVVTMVACVTDVGPTATAPAVEVATAVQSSTAPVWSAQQWAQASTLPHYLLSDATLYLTPTMAERVKSPFNPTLETSNWMSNLMRSQRIEVCEVVGEWARVKVDSGARGWMMFDRLVPAEGLAEAALIGDSPGFAEPRVTARKREPMIPTGTIVWVKRAADGQAEVYYNTAETLWLPAAKLGSSADDIEVARVIAEVRWSKDHDNLRGPHYKFLRKAKSKGLQSQLLDVLRLEVMEEGPSLAPER